MEVIVMAYADYVFYTKEYGGKTISEENFPALANRAAAYIDMATSGRSQLAAGEALTAVKMANCALSEIFQDEVNMAVSSYTTEGRLSSETVGSWSRTYRNEAASGVDISWLNNRKEEALLMWLGNTGFLKVRAIPRCQCFHIR